MGTVETWRVQQPLFDAAWAVLDRHRELVQSTGPFYAEEAWRLRQLALAAVAAAPSPSRQRQPISRFLAEPR